MTMRLAGKEVADVLTAQLQERVSVLSANGTIPTLAIVRVGERPDDLAYERGALSRCGKVGVAVKQFLLPLDVTQEELLSTIQAINEDNSIHGCLLFRPLPAHLDESAICQALDAKKDVDGITNGSMATIFSGSGAGYPPCTAEACIEILRHYQIPMTGKRIVVVGRSLVVGRPVAMLLLQENATVTICHSKSENMEEVCRQADILVVAAGKAGLIDASYVAPHQVVVDVGIHMTAEGKLTGDVCYDAVAPLVSAITPVPGGVGSVTSTLLCAHTVQAAEGVL